MAAIPFQLKQKEIRSISNPARVTAIGGDNGTEFNLFFPYLPPGSQWVFPFTYGFMYVVDSPSYQPVKIDASQTPPGSQVPVTTTKIANLVAYDTDQVFNPGIISTSVGAIPQTVFFRQVGNGVTIVVAGVAGKTIKIFSILMSVDLAVAGGFASVQDTGGLTQAQIQANVVSSVPYPLLQPVNLALGAGLQVNNQGALNCSYSITYTQG
jgi:hypothetical protein